MSKRTWLILSLVAVILVSLVFGAACAVEEAEEGALTPAEFELSNLRIIPAEIKIGEKVTISVMVKNIGEITGTKTVTLTIDGVELQTEDVTLAGGAADSVIFTVETFPEATAGVYEVEVDGLIGNFTLTEPAEAVEILNHSSYLDTDTGWYCIVGEVKNTSTKNLDYVELTATFYNAGGTVIDTDFTYTDIDTLIPGQKSPFEIILLDEVLSAQVDHYAVVVSDSIITEVEPYREFAILSHSSSIDGYGWYHVVGEVKNTGTEVATYVEVVATFYDATGTVIATEFTFTQPEDLAAGQVAPFELTVLDETLSAKIVSYELQVQ